MALLAAVVEDGGDDLANGGSGIEHDVDLREGALADEGGLLGAVLVLVEARGKELGITEQGDDGEAEALVLAFVDVFGVHGDGEWEVLSAECSVLDDGDGLLERLLAVVTGDDQAGSVGMVSGAIACFELRGE